MRLRLAIAGGLVAVLGIAAPAAAAAPAPHAPVAVVHPDSGCGNVAVEPFGDYKNFQGDYETPPTMHVSTTCNVYTWNVTVVGHACGLPIEVYITEPHNGPISMSETYTGYHVVLTCGLTHILMANLPVSTVFGIAIHQVSGGPNPSVCGPGELGCEVTIQW